MILNLIHPHVYSLSPTDNDSPASQEREEINAKIGELVQEVLDSGNKVVLQLIFDTSGRLNKLMQQVILAQIPSFGPLLDLRVKKVVIDGDGHPGWDKKPPLISDTNWKILKRLMSSHSELGRIYGGSETLIFAGNNAELETLGAALYAKKNYRRGDDAVWYLPELCVSKSRSLSEEITSILQQNSVFDLSVRSLEKNLKELKREKIRARIRENSR